MIDNPKYPAAIDKVRVSVVGDRRSLSELEPTHLLTDFDACQNETDRAKHVYASYGVAVSYAQCLEHGLITMAILEARAAGRLYFLHEADEFESRFSRKTLGGMLKRVREIIDIDPEALEPLEIALRIRNELAHGYFTRNAVAIMHDKGQREMIEQLCRSVALFRIADTIIGTITECFLKLFGITQRDVDREFEAIMRSVPTETPAASS